MVIDRQLVTSSHSIHCAVNCLCNFQFITSYMSSQLKINQLEFSAMEFFTGMQSMEFEVFPSY